MKIKRNNWSEREAGYLRYYRAEKTARVWARQKDARGENIKINYGLNTMERRKRGRQKKRRWKTYKQTGQQEI